MSRHAELADLAIQRAQDLHAMKMAAEDVAEQLCNALANYLGSPEEEFQYCKVSPGLYPGQKPQPGEEWWPVVGRGFPGLVSGQGDGFYYFALRIVFTRGCYYNIPRLVFGIRKSGDTYLVKMPNREDRPIDPSSDADVSSFCDAVYQGLKSHFASPIELSEKEIGFHAIEHPQLVEK